MVPPRLPFTQDEVYFLSRKDLYGLLAQPVSFIIIPSSSGCDVNPRAAEHHVIYQYNLVNAKNHYLGLIQTESVCFSLFYKS